MKLWSDYLENANDQGIDIMHIDNVYEDVTKKEKFTIAVGLNVAFAMIQSTKNVGTSLYTQIYI
jgi:hypothetical protein